MAAKVGYIECKSIVNVQDAENMEFGMWATCSMTITGPMNKRFFGDLMVLRITKVDSKFAVEVMDKESCRTRVFDTAAEACEYYNSMATQPFDYQYLVNHNFYQANPIQFVAKEAQGG
jgi:hypothetical protein